MKNPKAGEEKGKIRKIISRFILVLSLTLNILLFTLLLLHSLKMLFPPDWHIQKPAEETIPRVPLSSGAGTFMNLRNVKFFFNDQIYININWLTAKGIPYEPNRILDMDNAKSYMLEIMGGEATLDLTVMEHIFNKRVFAYPNPAIKNVTVSTVMHLIDNKPQRMLLIKGEMDMVFWIPFEMIASMSLDRKNNLMVITAVKIKSLGMQIAGIMDIIGLELESLLSVPPGRGLRIKGNSMIVEPFALFPPPRMNGRIGNVTLNSGSVNLSFQENGMVRLPPRPYRNATNDMLLFKGDVKIGRLRVINAYMQIVDRDQSDPFEFHILRYFEQLTRSTIKVNRNQSVITMMPDLND